MKITLRANTAVAGIVALLLTAGVHAQTFPSKPMRLVLPFPAGGPTDILGRTLAQKLGEAMGQTMVADNRPGAGGKIGRASCRERV